MDDMLRDHPRKFLIVSGNSVVVRRLRHMLDALGNCSIDTVSHVREIDEAGYTAAFIGVPLGQILHNGAVRDMYRKGTRVIVLNEHISRHSYAGTGLLPLSQPFTFDDVMDILRGIGVEAVQH